MLQNAKAVEANQHRKTHAWDSWHGWKLEEYCSLIRAADDENEVLRKKAATDHYDNARDRYCFGGSRLDLSGFTRLPRELLDTILEFLDPASRICLRFSCRYLYFGCGATSIFNTLYPTQFDTNPAVRLDWRFISEWFPGYHHIPSKKLCCSRCQTRHYRKYFDDEQRIRLPSKRACKGQLRQLCVSPDLCINFANLEETRKRKEATISIHFDQITLEESKRRIHVPALTELETSSSSQLLQGSPHLISWSGQSTPYLQLRCIKKTSKHNSGIWRPPQFEFQENLPSFYLRYFWRFHLVLPSTGNLSLDFVTNALKDPKIHLCPHLKFGDPAVASAIYAYRSKDYFTKTSKSIIIKCSSCETTFKILQLKGDPGLIIQVTRSLGILDSAGEEQWLAHLE